MDNKSKIKVSVVKIRRLPEAVKHEGYCDNTIGLVLEASWMPAIMLYAIRGMEHAPINTMPSASVIKVTIDKIFRATAIEKKIIKRISVMDTADASATRWHFRCLMQHEATDVEVRVIDEQLFEIPRRAMLAKKYDKVNPVAWQTNPREEKVYN